MNQFGKLAEKIGILVQGGTVNVGQIRLDSEMSRQELRNRKALLNNVRTAWVEGVLEKSLHEQIPIVLGLENRPNAVASPWNLDLINPDQSCQPLPTGTLVIDVFDQLGEGGTLLILGEPGAGKTITLLQLARDLIARAEEEIDRRIPVVLNLSSWAAENQTIAKWIVEELNSKYQVNRKIGQQWVEKQELLLLLDGLDEIRDLEKRNACVTELNIFQQEQAAEMVVCCRVRDYEELGDYRLKLRSALIVQPLTTNQIQTYLNQLQSNVTALKVMLTQDETLQELAQSPLLLNIMVLAYNGIEVADSPKITIDSNPIKQVWDDYIERMFQGSRLFAHLTISKSPEKHSYSRKDTTHWLVWMAKQMIQYSQSIFLIEKMQLDSIMQLYKKFYFDRICPLLFEIEMRLGETVVKKIYTYIDPLFDLFFLGLPFLIVYIFLFMTVASMIYHVFPGYGWQGSFTASFSISLLLLWYFLGEIMPVESIRFYIEIDKANFKKIHTFSLKYAPLVWSVMSVIFLVSGMLGPVAYAGQYKDSIDILAHIFVRIVICSYFMCFIIGSIKITDWFKLKLLKFGLARIQVNSSVYPNQGIIKSAVNAVLMGGILGMVGSIVYIYVNSLNISPSYGIALIKSGLIVALPCILHYGGKACLQHFVLRLILYLTGSIPCNYAKFLDWASDKLFLQKVGGGYIFIHRSLMEHFAEMENGSGRKR